MPQHEALPDMIEQAVVAHDELLRLLQQQRKALIEQHRARVRELTASIERQLGQVAECMLACEQCVQQVTLDKLASKHFDRLTAMQLDPQQELQLWESLRRVTQQAQAEGQLNQEIIADLLAYTDYSLRLLTPDEEQAKGYDGQGRPGCAGSHEARPQWVNRAA